MSFSPLIGLLHIGTAIALGFLALVSIWIAVLTAVNPGVDQANKNLIKRANIVGLFENIVAVILTLTGVIAAILGSWSFSELWLWLSLMIMAFYSAALMFVTKPARLVVAKDGSAIKAGMQIILQTGHFLLVVVAYFLMLLKPH
ncbi:MAG: hypothetical protein GY916_03635 [Gammaproteobacteria bacterium]|jgi:hypothetical protein|nr:hypothetical protein [Chromatiales bacterium]MCP4925018.1 hypothetical protein [Gammaproteobacteria bacterium]